MAYCYIRSVVFVAAFSLTAIEPALPQSRGPSQPPAGPMFAAGLPAAAVTDMDLVEPEPPKDLRLPVLHPPSTLLPSGDPAEPLSETQKAIRIADRHFQFGKFCIQEGKPEEARKEFDLAVDTLLAVPAEAPDRVAAEKKLEELARLIHRYDLDSLGPGIALDVPVYVQAPVDEILDLTFPVDPRLKYTTLAQLTATSSQLPLTVNDAVLSYINYFTNSTRGRRTLLYGLRRAGRYDGMISRILAEEGVPQEMIHLAQAESGFIPMALSRKAAAGMWQFVRFRGAEYGLDSSRTYDNRLDPEMATRAAARHLRDLYTQLGDWYLAMAAYNCGPLCVERAVQRTGYADFWELRRREALPRETRNYVPAILAMAIVTKNLSAYGLTPLDPEPELEYDTIKAAAPTGLALIADSCDLPVAEIKAMNPSVLRGVAPAGHEVHVPRGKGAAIVAAISTVPEEKRAAWRLHRISEGETVASISRKYSTPANLILTANAGLGNEPAGALESGGVLLIPAKAVAEPASSSSKGKKYTTAKRTYTTGSRQAKPARTTQVAKASAPQTKPVAR